MSDRSSKKLYNKLVGCKVSVNLYSGEMVSTGCGKIWEIFEFSEF